MEDPKEMEIKRLEHLKNFVEMHPLKIEERGDEYIRADGVIEMIEKTMAAVRKEQAHRSKN